MLQRGLTAFFFIASLSVVAVACGGSVEQSTGGAGGTGTGTGTTTGTGTGTGAATAQSYCEGKVAREKMCDPANAGTVQQCIADGDTKCLFSGIRPEVRDAIVSCLNDRPCNKGDDDCFYEPGLTAPVAGQNEFLSACQAKLGECSNLKDDYCSATILKAADYATLNQCLTQPCATVNDCVKNTFQAFCPDA